MHFSHVVRWLEIYLTSGVYWLSVGRRRVNGRFYLRWAYGMKFVKNEVEWAVVCICEFILPWKYLWLELAAFRIKKCDLLYFLRCKYMEVVPFDVVKAAAGITFWTQIRTEYVTPILRVGRVYGLQGKETQRMWYVSCSVL